MLKPFSIQFNTAARQVKGENFGHCLFKVGVQRIMSQTDIARGLLSIAANRYRILGDDLTALGEDGWHILLILFSAEHLPSVLRPESLEEGMRYPANLNRILKVLSMHGFVEERLRATNGDQSFRVTKKAISKIQLILNSETNLLFQSKP